MRLPAVLALAVTLLASRAAVADYSPPSFSQCVFDADFVVVGRIESLSEKDYVLRVEEWLAGTPKSETLTIRRFDDWTCAHREPKYEVGQRFVAFLERQDGALVSMGGGCEGDVVLEEGVARMKTSPGGDRRLRSAVSETRFVGAVRALLTGWSDIGAPRFAEAWRALLSNPEPIVVVTAIERLGRRADTDVNPEPGSAFADALVNAVANPDRDVRIYAAQKIGSLLGPAERYAASRRLAATVRSTNADLRPAAVLARVSLRPDDPWRHIEVLRLLNDESVPLGERTAMAEALNEAPVTALEPEAVKRVDPVARQVIGSMGDAPLLLRLSAYLDRLHRGYGYPQPTAAEQERARWLGLLPDVPPVATDTEPDEVAPPASPYISAVERAVFVPRDAEERPRIARIVRAVRRARNAERAHDDAAALDAYRDALTAAYAIGDATRRVVTELGVDLEEVGRTARDLDAAQK